MKLLRLGVGVASEEDGAGRVAVHDEPWPVIGQGELLIKVHAASIDPFELPGIVLLVDAPASVALGVGFAGVVQQVGKDCLRTDIAEGDQVVGVLGVNDTSGALAEHVVAPEYSVVHKPLEVPFSAAAAVVPGALFAFLGLCYQTRLRAGDTVLVMNGASAIGHVVIQLAAHWGANVATTATTMADLLFLQSSASRHCEIADLSDTTATLPYFVDEFTGSAGFDFVLDTITADVMEVQQSGTAAEHTVAVINALGSTGKWITGNALDILTPKLQRTLHAKSASVVYTNIMAWICSGRHASSVLHSLTDALQLMEKGTLNVTIAEEVSITDAAKVINNGSFTNAAGVTIVKFAD